VRQLLTESLLLAVMGGVAGLLLLRGISLLVRASPQLRHWVLSQTGRACVQHRYSLVSGNSLWYCARHRRTRTDPNFRLKEKSTRGGVALQIWIDAVVTQVAVSLILLVGAGLFARKFDQVKVSRSGFHLTTFCSR